MSVYPAGLYRRPLSLDRSFELPFMNENAEASSQAVWSTHLTTPAVQKEFAGVKPLMLHTHDEGYVHTKENRSKPSPISGASRCARRRGRPTSCSPNSAQPRCDAALPAVPEAMSKV